MQHRLQFSGIKKGAKISFHRHFNENVCRVHTKRQVIIKMYKFNMFITAGCVLHLRHLLLFVGRDNTGQLLEIWVVRVKIWAFVDALGKHPLCHRMWKVTKGTSEANNIMRNAIDSTSITFRWTSSSSRQSVFPTTTIAKKTEENGSQSRKSDYLVKIGPWTSEPLLG